MFFIFIILTLSMHPASVFDLSPGKPVPHADILESVIRSQLGNDSENSGLIFHYLDGDDDISEDGDINTNVLDINSVRKLVKIFKKRYEKSKQKTQPKPQTGNETGSARRADPQGLNDYYGPLMIPKTYDLMLQCIYGARYRLQETNRFRKLYKHDYSYNIAILVASMEQVIMKMDNLRREMREHFQKTHFLWYLLLYEKILTMNVDVSYMANKIWDLHNEYMKNVVHGVDDGSDYEEEEPETTTTRKPPFL